MKRRSRAGADVAPAGWRRLLNPFDVTAIAGALVNVLVISLLIGHWIASR